MSAVATPTKGRRTFVAAGTGLVFRDLVASDRIPMDRVTGVAIGDFMPETVVAVGEAAAGGNLRFSLDGGESWRPCPKPPTPVDGSVAVSSIGTIWVWSSARGSQRTEDYGFSWSPCSDLPAGVPVVADRTSSRLFYAVAQGRLYVSEDGARTFAVREVDLPDGDVPVEVVPVPGRAGDLWLLTKRGLYRALPGRTFERVPGVTDPVALGLGIARQRFAPGPLRQTAFLQATVDGRSGLYRSEREGSGWSLLENAPSNVIRLMGDPSHEGRVYAVTNGNELLVGQPE